MCSPASLSLACSWVKVTWLLVTNGLRVEVSHQAKVVPCFLLIAFPLTERPWVACLKMEEGGQLKLDFQSKKQILIGLSLRSYLHPRIPYPLLTTMVFKMLSFMPYFLSVFILSKWTNAFWRIVRNRNILGNVVENMVLLILYSWRTAEITSISCSKVLKDTSLLQQIVSELLSLAHKTFSELTCLFFFFF